jgi:hypothetical protein
MGLSAQVAVNPQLGVSFQNLSNTSDDLEAKANIGWMVGSDFRVGERLYFQPGVFFQQAVTTVTVGDSAVIEDDLVRSYASLKAHAGYNIIDGGEFRLRANAGVAYDLLLGVTNKDDKLEFDKKDFSDGVWTASAGVGADITFITLETGASFGLSDLFSDDVALSEDVKHLSWYLTVGVVFGGATE